MKKTLFGIGIAAVIVCLFSANTFADVAQVVTHQDRAKTGVVIGVQAGYAQNNIKDEFKKFPIDFKKGNLFGGVTLGYEYALFSELAVGIEGGLFYGQSTSKINKKRINDLLLPVMGTIRYVSPINLTFFVKGGLSFVNLSVKYKHYDSTINFDHHWAPIVAGGIGYDIKDVNVFVQYAHIFKKTYHLYNTDAITCGVELKLPVVM